MIAFGFLLGSRRFFEWCPRRALVKLKGEVQELQAELAVISKSQVATCVPYSIIVI